MEIDPNRKKKQEKGINKEKISKKANNLINNINNKKKKQKA